MRIKISKRALKWMITAMIVVSALVGFYFLGNDLTPKNAIGRPLILSPSVRQAVLYRRSVQRWLSDLKRIDADIDSVLVEGDITEPGQLYELNDQAQRLNNQTAGVVQDVAFTAAPPALVSLQQQVYVVVEAYYEAAQATALWVGAPEEETFETACAKLELARALREELATSRWLLEYEEKEHDRSK